MELWTAFVLGLFGSLHCAGMCGPLAMALPATGASTVAFATGRAAYNLGRVLTYCTLGLIFGFIGRNLWLAGIQRWVSITLGILLLVGLFSSKRLAVSSPVTRLVGWLKIRMAFMLRQRSFAAMTLLGMLNGLLPCGLVYVACAGAATTTDSLSGAAYMAAFGAGTVPMMLAISLSGKLIPTSLRLKLVKAIPVSVFLLAMLLILRGMSLGIPYISPTLTADGSIASCCKPNP
ncbi:MAG TPA: sulfite exporter TauE/SafE family protein [Candidatus Paceibacterota bacterium]|nr:sulfite exporter TauE/SafE family protein [Candidatus Paceibacterota bacterium]